MEQHNCRIGKTYFKYPGYICNVRNQINKIDPKDLHIYEKFIKHLIETGKIDKSL